MDHARIIAGLDLLITIDSMPAHLAGALNVPVWLMLPVKADWRWMEERSDSPWYPSMRIFRQEKQGDWASIIEQAGSELQKLIRTGVFS
jgi:ADP-heptose:LPS heptosyltransferase